LGITNSGGAIIEPVPPEPHIMNGVNRTRLELDKTRNDTSRRDDGNQNTKFSTMNIVLTAEGGGNSGDKRLGIK
jgi:hypothetical protein